MAGRQGSVEEGLGGGRGLDDLPLGEVATRRHPHERLPALRIGRVDERAALHEQAVEEVDCDRYPGDRRLHVVNPPEPAHELLER